VLQPFPLCAEELVRPPTFSGDRASYLQDPASCDPLDVATQVAAGHAQDLVRRTGQGGEQLAMLAFDTFRPERKFATGGFAFVIGQKRVIVRRRGAETFCESEHHNEIEIEADAHARRADQHALPHAPNPAKVGFELELESAGENVEADRLLDAVEAGQPVERSLRRSAAFCSAGGQLIRRLSPPNSSSRFIDGPTRPFLPTSRVGRRPRTGRLSNSRRTSGAHAHGQRFREAPQLATEVRRDLPRQYLHCRRTRQRR
jgi:hypothetical protein